MTFVNSNGGTDAIDFQADGPGASVLNKIRNFVVTTVGDMLFRASGGNNDMERLAIGSSGQVLTVVSGLPGWRASVPGASVFTAYATASTSDIPTSRNGGSNSGTWFKLNGSGSQGTGTRPFVTWSDASPGCDPDGVFSTAAGAGYGKFTVPDAGVYGLFALVTFDSGASMNTGAGLPASPLPSGSAVRQARIVIDSGPGAGTVLALVTRQVEAASDNTTCLSLYASAVDLASGSVIGIEVRHDLPNSEACSIADTAVSSQGQTYFSGYRIR